MLAAHITAYAHIRDHQKKGEVVTGLLYISQDSVEATPSWGCLFISQFLHCEMAGSVPFFWTPVLVMRGQPYALRKRPDFDS